MCLHPPFAQLFLESLREQAAFEANTKPLQRWLQDTDLVRITSELAQLLQRAVPACLAEPYSGPPQGAEQRLLAALATACHCQEPLLDQLDGWLPADVAAVAEARLMDAVDRLHSYRLRQLGKPAYRAAPPRSAGHDDSACGRLGPWTSAITVPAPSTMS